MEDKLTLTAKLTPIQNQEAQEQVLALANASKEHLIPDEVRGPQNIDLLPTAFSLAVVGKANLNDDVIDRDTALAIAPRFVHRQINIEHQRNMIVGHIVNYGFSNLETGEPLTPEEIIATDLQVFNLDLSAVVYRVAADPLANLLIEANNPESDNHQAISTSWELMFSDTFILLGADSLNDPNAKILTEPQSKELFAKFLKSRGGKGVDDKGRPVKRLITIHASDVIPAGAGYVTQPAAAVKGVEVFSNDNVDIPQEEVEAQEEEKLEAAASTDDTPEDQKDENKNPKSVNPLKTKKSINFLKPKTSFKDMSIKLSELKDITQNWDELVQADAEEAKAAVSAMEKHITDKITEHSEKYSAEKKAKEEVQANLEKTQTELEKLQTELKEIKESQAAQEAEATFNSRMSALDEEFELDESTRKVVAKRIQGLDEDGFASWKEEFDVLAAEKKRENKEKKDKARMDDKEDDKEDEDKDDKAKSDDKDKEKAKASDDASDEDSKDDEKENQAFANLRQNFDRLYNGSTEERFGGTRFAKVFEQKSQIVKDKR